MPRPSLLHGVFALCTLALCGCPSAPGVQSLSQHLALPPPFVVATWGPGRDQLGHQLREEAASDGPMSLTTDAEGRLFVLDQVNSRVQIIAPDGRFSGTIPIEAATVQDLAVTGRDRVWLLDRYAEELALVDFDGRRLSRLPLVGNGVGESAAVTGLFAFDGAIGVEVERSLVVRLGNLEGAPDVDRKAFDGVPSRAGGTWQRAVLDPSAPDRVLIYDATAWGALDHRRSVRFGLPVQALRGLFSDQAGNLYLAVLLAQYSAAPPFEVQDEREEVAVISREGRVLARAAFEPTLSPEEQFKDFAVAPDGTVYHLRCAEQGAVITRWTR